MYPNSIYTLALKYLYRDYIKAKVYTIWVHGPLGPAFGSEHVSTSVFFTSLSPLSLQLPNSALTGAHDAPGLGFLSGIRKEQT